MSHDIVHFRNRKAQLVFTECELHKGQRCVIQCQQSQTPICYKCCIGPHKHHNNVDIVDLVGNKKEEIQRESVKLKMKSFLIARKHMNIYGTIYLKLQQKLIKSKKRRRR